MVILSHLFHLQAVRTTHVHNVKSNHLHPHDSGQPIVYPRNDLSYAENFLYMMFAVPTEEFVLRPEFVRTVCSYLCACNGTSLLK